MNELDGVLVNHLDVTPPRDPPSQTATRPKVFGVHPMEESKVAYLLRCEVSPPMNVTDRLLDSRALTPNSRSTKSLYELASPAASPAPEKVPSEKIRVVPPEQTSKKIVRVVSPATEAQPEVPADNYATDDFEEPSDNELSDVTPEANKADIDVCSLSETSLTQSMIDQRALAKRPYSAHYTSSRGHTIPTHATPETSPSQSMFSYEETSVICPSETVPSENGDGCSPNPEAEVKSPPTMARPPSPMTKMPTVASVNKSPKTSPTSSPKHASPAVNRHPAVTRPPKGAAPTVKRPIKVTVRRGNNSNPVARKTSQSSRNSRPTSPRPRVFGVSPYSTSQAPPKLKKKTSKTKKKVSSSVKFSPTDTTSDSADPDYTPVSTAPPSSHDEEEEDSVPKLSINITEIMSAEELITPTATMPVVEISTDEDDGDYNGYLDTGKNELPLKEKNYSPAAELDPQEETDEETGLPAIPQSIPPHENDTGTLEYKAPADEPPADVVLESVPEEAPRLRKISRDETAEGSILLREKTSSGSDAATDVPPKDDYTEVSDTFDSGKKSEASIADTVEKVEDAEMTPADGDSPETTENNPPVLTAADRTPDADSPDDEVDEGSGADTPQIKADESVTSEKILEDTEKKYIIWAHGGKKKLKKVVKVVKPWTSDIPELQARLSIFSMSGGSVTESLRGGSVSGDEDLGVDKTDKVGGNIEVPTFPTEEDTSQPNSLLEASKTSVSSAPLTNVTSEAQTTSNVSSSPTEPAHKTSGGDVAENVEQVAPESSEGCNFEKAKESADLTNTTGKAQKRDSFSAPSGKPSPKVKKKSLRKLKKTDLPTNSNDNVKGADILDSGKKSEDIINDVSPAEETKDESLADEDSPAAKVDTPKEETEDVNLGAKSAEDTDSPVLKDGDIEANSNEVVTSDDGAILPEVKDGEAAVKDEINTLVEENDDSPVGEDTEESDTPKQDTDSPAVKDSEVNIAEEDTDSPAAKNSEANIGEEDTDSPAGKDSEVNIDTDSPAVKDSEVNIAEEDTDSPAVKNSEVNIAEDSPAVKQDANIPKEDSAEGDAESAVVKEEDTDSPAVKDSETDIAKEDADSPAAENSEADNLQESPAVKESKADILEEDADSPAADKDADSPVAKEGKADTSKEDADSPAVEDSETDTPMEDADSPAAKEGEADTQEGADTPKEEAEDSIVTTPKEDADSSAAKGSSEVGIQSETKDSEIPVPDSPTPAVITRTTSTVPHTQYIVQTPASPTKQTADSQTDEPAGDEVDAPTEKTEPATDNSEDFTEPGALAESPADKAGEVDTPMDRIEDADQPAGKAEEVDESADETGDADSPAEVEESENKTADVDVPEIKGVGKVQSADSPEIKSPDTVAVADSPEFREGKVLPSADETKVPTDKAAESEAAEKTQDGEVLTDSATSETSAPADKGASTSVESEEDRSAPETVDSPVDKGAVDAPTENDGDNVPMEKTEVADTPLDEAADTDSSIAKGPPEDSPLDKSETPAENEGSIVPSDQGAVSQPAQRLQTSSLLVQTAMGMSAVGASNVNVQFQSHVQVNAPSQGAGIVTAMTTRINQTASGPKNVQTFAAMNVVSRSPSPPSLSAGNMPTILPAAEFGRLAAPNTLSDSEVINQVTEPPAGTQQSPVKGSEEKIADTTDETTTEVNVSTENGGKQELEHVQSPTENTRLESELLDSSPDHDR